MNAKLKKLIAIARKAHAPSRQLAEEDVQAPFGFATRVIAQWSEESKQERGRVWERLCWWGAATSVAICLVVFVQQHARTEANAFDVLLNTPAEDAEML